MSKTEKFHIPAWVKPEERAEFAVRLAALYYSMDGSLGKLSKALGGSTSMLHMAFKNPNGISPQTCIKLEELLGRDHFPREFFRPDIFVAE